MQQSGAPSDTPTLKTQLRPWQQFKFVRWAPDKMGWLIERGFQSEPIVQFVYFTSVERIPLDFQIKKRRPNYDTVIQVIDTNLLNLRYCGNSSSSYFITDVVFQWSSVIATTNPPEAPNILLPVCHKRALYDIASCHFGREDLIFSNRDLFLG